MVQSFDTDTFLYSILKNTASISGNLTGSVYAGQRPLNSVVEDITINTIALTQEYEPQLGTSNVNIHVADQSVNIGGVNQKFANRARLKFISGLVLNALRSAKITGVGFTIENQTMIQESDISQHYVNIRINWFIH